MTIARLLLALLTAALVLAREGSPTLPPRVTQLPGPAIVDPRKAEPAAATPAPTVVAPQTGDRLLIPAIDVNAAIDPVGIDREGKVAAPSSPMSVGWYRLGEQPGDPGSALFDGHLDWAGGHGVFWNLRMLNRGDRVSVLRGGRRFDFAVTAARRYAFNQPPPATLFARSGPSTLALITCDGAWDGARHSYLQRLVVEAALATPDA